MLDVLSTLLGELELSKLYKVEYNSPVWEKWQSQDCSHLDTICTEHMDSRTHFAYLRDVREYNGKVHTWNENHAVVNPLLFQNFDPEMKKILKTHENWELANDSNCRVLLDTICDVMKAMKRKHKKEKENS